MYMKYMKKGFLVMLFKYKGDICERILIRKIIGIIWYGEWVYLFLNYWFLFKI